jgi:hypothetical protein
VKVLAALALASWVAAAADDVALEYRVKAAYLLNFTRFVEWPADPADTGPLTICIAGTNPFDDVLDETLRDEQVGARAIRSRPARESERCHVLFIPNGVSPDAYIKSTRAQPVLTVGESPDFLRRGGIVNFFIENGKVRFEIDAERAERAGLRISSRLLRLARTPTEAATADSEERR